MSVFDYKEIVINGYPAKFAYLQADNSTKGYSVMFGDSSFCTMVMAFYPATDQTTEKDLLISLNSLYYDKNTKIFPFANANFTLNDNACKLKFKQYMASLYIYSIEGVEDKDNPVAIVTQYPKNDSMTRKSIVDVFIAKFQQKGFSDLEIKNKLNKKINMYDAYEAEMYGKMNDNNCLIYFCVVEKNNKAIVIQGVSRKTHENDLIEFKKLANTIHIK